MAIASAVPWMRPGRTVWNALLGAIYLVLLAALAAVLATLAVCYRPVRGC